MVGRILNLFLKERSEIEGLTDDKVSEVELGAVGILADFVNILFDKC